MIQHRVMSSTCLTACKLKQGKEHKEPALLRYSQQSIDVTCIKEAFESPTKAFSQFMCSKGAYFLE